MAQAWSVSGYQSYFPIFKKNSLFGSLLPLPPISSCPRYSLDIRKGFYWMVMKLCFRKLNFMPFSQHVIRHWSSTQAFSYYVAWAGAAESHSGEMSQWESSCSARRDVDLINRRHCESPTQTHLRTPGWNPKDLVVIVFQLFEKHLGSFTHASIKI